jgi:hypothetical protein
LRPVAPGGDGLPGPWSGAGGTRMRLRGMTIRNVVFALLGAAVLVLKGQWGGRGEDVVHAYAGNAGVSFALSFAVLNATTSLRRPRSAAAAVVFAAVTAFETTGGFGILENVYDPLDILADAVGIALAVLADIASSAALRRAA